MRKLGEVDSVVGREMGGLGFAWGGGIEGGRGIGGGRRDLEAGGNVGGDVGMVPPPISKKEKRSDVARVESRRLI